MSWFFGIIGWLIERFDFFRWIFNKLLPNRKNSNEILSILQALEARIRFIENSDRNSFEKEYYAIGESRRMGDPIVFLRTIDIGLAEELGRIDKDFINGAQRYIRNPHMDVFDEQGKKVTKAMFPNEYLQKSLASYISFRDKIQDKYH